MQKLSFLVWDKQSYASNSVSKNSTNLIILNLFKASAMICPTGTAYLIK